MKRLHLGCGRRILPGWTHIDAQPSPNSNHIDVLTTIDDLHMFDDGSVREIYACHVLEHIGRHDIDKVLSEWARVLQTNGVVRISVPDWDAVVAEYTSNGSLDSVLGFVCGGQRDHFDYHNMMFNFETLERALHRNGFDAVKRYDWWEFLPEGMDDYSRSYLPHMDFEHGRLMSLNVIASKSEA